MKETKIKKDKFIQIRVPEKLYNRMVLLADLYADGNLSVWIRHCITNYQPKFLIKK